MRIGVDLMGSDRSPLALFDAVLNAARHLEPIVTLVVFATQEIVNSLSAILSMQVLSADGAGIIFHVVADVIMMHDEPLEAVRHKKDSSLVRGIKLLKKRQLDAFVSFGNTGALIAGATLSIPLFPQIKRPALLAVLPSKLGEVAVLDVGGTVSRKASHLVQFALLGAAYQCSFHENPCPRVGLLNIGVESKKGTGELREAYLALEQLTQKKQSEGAVRLFQFVGNIEGRDLFEGKVDVLVTDGFTGNVLLKTTEGVSLFILDYLEQINKQSSSKTLSHSIEQLQNHFNYNEYPGAILCGIDGLIIKCHGSASPRAVLNGIKGAVRLVSNGLIQKVKQNLELILAL